jgi:hypothetical protein
MTPARIAFLTGILCFVAVVPNLGAQEESERELRGDVVSAATGEPVAGAWIALEGYGWGTYSRRNGHFRLPDVPTARRGYDVRALGYLPATLTLEPTRDARSIELTPDASLQDGLPFLLDHLEDRRNAGRVFDREVLAFSGAFNLGELLTARGVRRVRRFCLDEVTTPGLSLAPPDEFYLVEIHGSTVRAYTEEFLERTARQDLDTIQEIVRLHLPIC